MTNPMDSRDPSAHFLLGANNRLKKPGLLSGLAPFSIFSAIFFHPVATEQALPARSAYGL
jgi:hypothetical protein